MEKCATCGKQGDAQTIRRCSRCKAVRYCSTQCQSRDWPRHKLTCRESSVDGPPTGAGNSASEGTSRASEKSSTTSSSPSAQRNTTASNPLASLFDGRGTFYRTPWQQARSRAQEAFPGIQVADDLAGDLDLSEAEVEVEHVVPFMPFGLPFMSFPFLFAGLTPRVAKVRSTCGKILVLRLVTLLFVPRRVVWLAEDCKGRQIHLWFEIISPAPFFRFHDLQPGHFLCIKQAVVTILIQRRVSYVVLKDASLVRVFRI